MFAAARLIDTRRRDACLQELAGLAMRAASLDTSICPWRRSASCTAERLQRCRNGLHDLASDLLESACAEPRDSRERRARQQPLPKRLHT